MFDKKREDVPKPPVTAADESDFFNNLPSTSEEPPVEEVMDTAPPVEAENVATEDELTPEEAELVEVLTIPELVVVEEVTTEEPTIEDQNESVPLGKFKVTSIRAHVYVEPNVATRPITAVVRGNLLPFFGKEPMSMFCEVQVLNRRQEKVRGFIETLRGKVIS